MKEESVNMIEMKNPTRKCGEGDGEINAGNVVVVVK